MFNKDIVVNLPDFTRDDFAKKLKPRVLCESFEADRYDLPLKSAPHSVERLNEILQTGNFYEIWSHNPRTKDILKMVLEKKDVRRLLKLTQDYRHKSFSSLEPDQQFYIKKLNRILLEQTYPRVCPDRFSRSIYIWEWVESIVVALVLATIIRTFFLQPFKIPSGSMRMTLLEHDRLFVNKLRYGPKVPFTDYRLPGFSKPQRGDVIVFIFPEDPKKDFIKRLIAFGGETVEIRMGRIYINGRQTRIPGAENIYYYNERSDYGDVDEKVKVPANMYFVLGDNSASSHDSRFWGFVPEKNVIGKAEFIFWPPNRIRLIK